MTYDVITLGAATRDVYVRGSFFRIAKDAHSTTGRSLSLDFGAKYEVEDLLFESGGGATNTAVTFANFGLKTAFLGVVGKDVRAKAIMELMEKEGIATSLVTEDAKAPTAYSIILSLPAGERTILSYRGASKNAKALLQSVKKPWRASWMYVTSLGNNLDVIRAAFRKMKAKGGKIAWNPGGAELRHGKKLRPLLAQVDVLFLNLAEAKLLTGLKSATPEKLCLGLRKMTQAVLVLTGGRDGSWGCMGQTMMRAGIHNIPVVDTTGAGDAFGSGFLTGWIRKPRDLAFALQLGTANAEGTIGTVGAKTGLLTRVPTARSLVTVRKV